MMLSQFLVSSPKLFGNQKLILYLAGLRVAWFNGQMNS